MLRLLVAAICSLAVGIASADAQPFPSRPISLIVPYPAGGPLDQVARVMTEHMRGTLGQPFVIENISGAGGSIGVGRVARAAPIPLGTATSAPMCSTAPSISFPTIL